MESLASGSYAPMCSMRATGLHSMAALGSFGVRWSGAANDRCEEKRAGNHCGSRPAPRNGLRTPDPPTALPMRPRAAPCVASPAERWKGRGSSEGGGLG
eukprot:2430251-Alexandrium_andersonii.AAC.1